MATTKRRSRGSGSVYQRPEDGLWVGKCYTTTGGVRKRRVYYARTQAVVERKLREALHGLDHGRQPQAVSRKVGDWLETWLETRELRPSTAYRYRKILDHQLIPQLGPRKLSELQPSDVDRMSAALREQGLSPYTIQHVRSVLRAALSGAVRDGLVSQNVAKLSTAPHLRAPEPTVLSAQAVGAILDACDDPQLRRLVLVAVHAGMRQGEQLGLCWSAVDFEARCVYIRTTLERFENTYALGEPKSATSRRVLMLDDAAIEALNQEREAQKAAKAAAGKEWREPIAGLAFTTATGEPRNGSSILHSFQGALARAGLPRLRWHDLRAAHGALMLAAGTDLSVVSRRLGHSNVSVTARFYLGTSDILQRDAVEKFGKLLAR